MKCSVDFTKAPGKSLSPFEHNRVFGTQRKPEPTDFVDNCSGGSGASPPSSHFTRAWTGFRPSCLPNNLSGEESDQPRQKTRLTVPLREIRSLTE